jgi:glycosyltransferase involved in cell wall biosynthesis
MVNKSISNLHISMTPFTHESRVLKEVNTIINHSNIRNVYISALHEDNLLENEKIGTGLFLKRFRLKTRFLPKAILFQSFKYVELLFQVYFFYRNKNIKILNIHTLALLPLGVLLKFLFNARLVYDTHELETETRNLKGIKKKLAKLTEYLFINYCDDIICVNQPIANWYMKNYKMDSSPKVVLNTPVFKKLKKKKNLFREEFNIPEETTISLYQGGLTTGRNIELLLETFSNLKSSKSVIIFMGYGPLEEKVKRYAEIKSNIFFKPAVSQELLMDYTSSADIGFVLIDKGSLNNSLSLPNKLFEYAMAGIGVIASDNNEIKKFVQNYNCGFCLEDVNNKFLTKTLELFTDENTKLFSVNALKMFEENNWSHQEKALIDIYKEY